MWEAGQSAALREAVARTAFGVVLAFCLAASIVLVSAHELVALLFQRGRFTAHDTQAVATLILILLPGFIAQGVGLVFTSSLSATKRNRAAISVGFVNFGVRTALIMALGLLAGATGVAVAYSAANCVVTLALAVICIRLAIWPEGSWASVRLFAAIGLGTLAAAFVLAWAGRQLPSAGRVGIVLGVFTVLWLGLTRSERGLGWRSLVPTLRTEGRVARDSAAP
jgi:peptidoglycan biosynthesis protein MviN/MurJ (putative lipid II flippase)